MCTARTCASLVALVPAAGCSDDDLAGPGEFVPAEQPDALEAETVTETFPRRRESRRR